ncbi:MAG: DUF1648 domain-containing protein [Phycisphaerae bacterium]|nr:DUF1648 domain-containing protein [Phycisphaerae bacterium]
MKRALLVYVALVGISAAECVYFYPKLPSRMASHFGASGQADGWMDKPAFFAVMTFTVVFVCGLFAMIQYALGVLGCGARWEESETAARQALVDLATRTTARLGVLTAALVVAVFHLSIQANLQPNPVLGHAVPLFILYGVLMAVLLIQAGVEQRRLAKTLPKPAIPPGVWFPAKSFGWGWGPPCAWQGWLFMALWFAALLIDVWLFVRGHALAGLAFMLLLVAVLLTVCWLKGEKPRWRWGDEDESTPVE